ncbi:Protein of unknown function [Bradyrhizobium brasilense]|uniref:Uncharacterized protein n=1 Tax=Bradyrhizobium brasilense TaxID=1419277 RepID=A0A1G7IG76_9BRAD|nr:Protein of unknown function [Bradyrhizobium brasilense]
MSPIRFSTSSLKEGRWYEYLIRFVLGGAATVFTGLISSRYGAVIGGVFLALPAIFCASATLIEKHEIRRKREAGLAGKRRGQMAAAVDAAGAALGALGMLAGLRGWFLDANPTRQHPRRLRRRLPRLVDYRGSGLVRAPENEIDADRERAQRLHEFANAIDGLAIFSSLVRNEEV